MRRLIPAESLVRRGRRRVLGKMLLLPKSSQCDVRLGGLQGGIEVPTTLAPRSDMALIVLVPPRSLLIASWTSRRGRASRGAALSAPHPPSWRYWRIPPQTVVDRRPTPRPSPSRPAWRDFWHLVGFLRTCTFTVAPVVNLTRVRHHFYHLLAL